MPHTYNTLEKAKENFQVGNLLLAKDVMRADKRSKTFMLFTDIDEFINHFRQCEETHYFEIIDGYQRLYMDIDVEEGSIPQEGLEHLSAYIQSVYSTQVNIYTSGENSYHIIFANICVTDNIQCKKRILELLEYYDDPYGIKQHVCMKVYKRNQQLRLLGSCKIGTTRYKVPWGNSTWSLTSSLVSYYHNPDNLSMLPDIDALEEEQEE